MTKKDLEAIVKEADGDNDGFINCKGKTVLGNIHIINKKTFFRVLFHPLYWCDPEREEEEKQRQCKQNKGGKWEEWLKQEWIYQDTQQGVKEWYDGWIQFTFYIFTSLAKQVYEEQILCRSFLWNHISEHVNKFLIKNYMSL